MMNQFNNRVSLLLLVVFFAIFGISSVVGVLGMGVEEVSAETASCDVPTTVYPSIATALLDPSCARISLTETTYVENLIIRRSVAISGIGDASIIDANNSRGVDVLTSEPVTLTKFTIKNGSVGDGGGGIRNTTGNLTIDSLLLVNNVAGAAGGGAIYNRDQSNLTILNSTFVGNSSSGWGGAIFNQPDSVLEIDNSSFLENTGRYSGGGVHTEGVTEIRNSQFYSNTVSGSLNRPNSGGAIYAHTFTETIKIENIFAKGNRAIISGGAIFSDGRISLSDSYLEGNSAVASGGGLYTREENAILSNVTLINNVAQVGGGYYSRLSNVFIEDSTFSLNQSNLNGGGVVIEFVTATIKSSRIDANMSLISGGGLWVNESVLEITDTSINDNILSDDLSTGGGLSAIGDSTTVTVKQSEFKGNMAAQGAGITTQSGILRLENSLVDGNSSEANGGGISAEATQLILRNSEISNNISGSDGAGLYLKDNDSFIQESTVSNNQSNGNGAGIFVENGIAELLISSVNDNSAANGGGIYNVGNLTVTYSTIYNNIATVQGGGLWNNGRLRTENLTVSGNEAEIGGGLYNDNGDPSIRFTTFANNLATEKSASVHSDRSALRLRNTILNQPRGGVSHCDGNLFSLGYNIGGDDSCNLVRMTDREFATAQLEALGDYGGPTLSHSMKPTSLAIDNGESDICPDVDQTGKFRPFGEGCDIGAYEFHGYSIGFKEPDMTIDEDAGVITVTIRLNQPWHGSPIPAVDFTVASGSATAGQDFEPSSGTITFAENTRGFKLVIPIFDDATGEADETFFVNLSNPNGVPISNEQLTITIADNDGGGQQIINYDFHVFLPFTHQ